MSDTQRPDERVDRLEQLCNDFRDALLEKARAAEQKYGYNDGWLSPDWRDDLVAKLLHHVEKGDPRDVALYCAFAWYHGWSISPNDIRAVLGVLNEQRARAERAEADVARLREALEWYADTDNLNDSDNSHGHWEGGSPDIMNEDAEWIWDKGSRARAALTAAADDEEITP